MIRNIFESLRTLFSAILIALAFALEFVATLL